MKFTTVALALSLAFLAACHRDNSRNAASGSSAAPRNEAAQTPTTPANAGTPSSAEKSEGRNPQQGQVDPKEPTQRKDFQQSGK